MRKTPVHQLLLVVLAAVSAAGLGACGSETPSGETTGSGSGASGWPVLPSSGFIVGRAASMADVESGDAVFVAQVGESIIGVPLDLQIPQYAYLTDAGGSDRIRVIIVQAENAGGTDMIGYLQIDDGSQGVGTLAEFELLGIIPPE
ncbi:MAG: hypothetical protein AAF430_17900 [Myxococcota bacterium]